MQPLPSFWMQAALLAAVVVALHLRIDGHWVSPLTGAWLREVAAAIVIAIGAFALASGGRGCAPSPWPDEEPGQVQDAPDPFHRS